MKKIFIIILIFLFIIGSILLSYSVAKTQAEVTVKKYGTQISPLKGHVVLFFEDKFEPCWVFTGEHKEKMTGTTLSVIVSFFGKVKEDRL